MVSMVHQVVNGVGQQEVFPSLQSVKLGTARTAAQSPHPEDARFTIKNLAHAEGGAYPPEIVGTRPSMG